MNIVTGKKEVYYYNLYGNKAVKIKTLAPTENKNQYVITLEDGIVAKINNDLSTDFLVVDKDQVIKVWE